MSDNLSLNSFLYRINYDNLYTLPYNNDAQTLAFQARNGRRIRVLTERALLKRNVEREACRLHLRNRHIINLATNKIWKSLTPSQRSEFINFANNVNRNRIINNSETINRIARIILPQVTSNPLENNFFNGTRFHDNNSFESLVLPAGSFL